MAGIQAVLFDVGGPLEVESEAEARIDGQIRERLAAHGVVVSDDEFEAANAWAVASFAPNAYTAIVWRLCGQDPELARRLWAAPFEHGPRTLRPGIAEILQRLRGRGLALGLAANQPAGAVDWLDSAGVGQFFAHREVSGHHGYRKPDVRVFLHACAGLQVAPEQCLMVGDRIDNDIVPARMLGMKTILLRTGRHAAQTPRSADEVPDVEVFTTEDLGIALDRLTA